MSYIFLDESGDLGFNFTKKKTPVSPTRRTLCSPTVSFTQGFYGESINFIGKIL